MDDLTLTEVIIACELKWRYRDVDEARLCKFLVRSDITSFANLPERTNHCFDGWIWKVFKNITKQNKTKQNKQTNKPKNKQTKTKQNKTKNREFIIENTSLIHDVMLNAHFWLYNWIFFRDFRATFFQMGYEKVVFFILSNRPQRKSTELVTCRPNLKWMHMALRKLKNSVVHVFAASN